MAGTPHNAAATRGWALVLALNEHEPEETIDWYTADFVRQDRRSMIGAPDVDAVGFIGQMRAWFEIGKGRPIFSPMEIVAVAGERCVAMRIRVGFPGETDCVEMIHVSLLDDNVHLMQRIISFDVDARDAAIAELDRMHASLA